MTRCAFSTFRRFGWKSTTTTVFITTCAAAVLYTYIHDKSLWPSGPRSAAEVSCGATPQNGRVGVLVVRLLRITHLYIILYILYTYTIHDIHVYYYIDLYTSCVISVCVCLRGQTTGRDCSANGRALTVKYIILYYIYESTRGSTESLLLSLLILLFN